MNDTTTALQEWIPYKLFYLNNEPACEWLYLNKVPFTEPFFADTISVCWSHEVGYRRRKVISSLDMLPRWSSAMDYVKPSAFIFHVSRCGSTLLSQFLSMDQKHIVLSEVPFLDELLRIPFDDKYDQMSLSREWFQTALPFYAQKRNGAEQHLFIKTDCWHIFFYERLRKLYPDTPFILLYRSPDEVLRSQQKQRGMQAVPGLIQPRLMELKLEENDPALTDLDLYFSKVLGKMLGAFVRVYKNDHRSLLVNYSEGMINVTKKLMEFSGIPLPDELLHQMEDRAGFHGKRRKQVFEKEPPAESPAFLEEAWKWYRELEKYRTTDNRQ
jgi:hypothetical protein